MEYFKSRKMHIHDSHEFYLALEGNGEQYTPQGTVKMKKGDVFIFPAGIKHIGNGTPDGETVGGVINLNEKFFFNDSSKDTESHKILRSLTQAAKKGNYRISMPPKGRKELFELFGKMLEESKIKKIGYKRVLNSMMHQFLIIILRNSKIEINKTVLENSVNLDKINDVIQFISTRFTDEIDIEQAAQIANMSRSYFHANFKAVTGVTYIEYLNGLRVEYAEQMLKTSEIDAGTIALKAGFTSVSHFYKVFKEITGTTPKKIRSKKKSNFTKF